MSLSHFDVGPEPQITEKLLRYTVRSDIAFANRLKAAARAKGVSVETLVQAHFDRILDAETPAPEPKFDPAKFDFIRFAQRNAISVTAARAWLAMRVRADASGIVRMTGRDLAVDLDLAPDSARHLITVLREADLLLQISGASPTGMTYRVVTP